MKKFIDEAGGLLPNTRLLADNSLAFIDGGSKIVTGARALDGSSDVSIRYAMEELRDGVVDLATAGFTNGDQFQLEVRYMSKGSDEMRSVESYNAVARRLGFHTRPQIGAGLIFYRGDSGANDVAEWRTNVAALAEWGYQFREPERFGSQLWNWIDPKFGTHVSSLDQGGSTVEFGAGGNLSILNGLIFGGYGYNLSEDDQYFMIGLSLLGVLNEAQSLSQKVQND